MIKITNITKSPVQVIIKSGRSNDLNVLNIPGMGKGKNTYFLEDERWTHYIDEAEDRKLIKQDKIAQKSKKGR